MMGPLIILSSILLIYNIIFEISERDYRKDDDDEIDVGKQYFYNNVIPFF
jgi:hypothetical protein